MRWIQNDIAIYDTLVDFEFNDILDIICEILNFKFQISNIKYQMSNVKCQI
jgi:hypothetical protein